jgi:Xaa-Pro aminopeptidase
MGLGDARLGLEMASMGVPQYRQLVELLPDATFEDCGSLMDEVRSIKTPEEIAIMKEGVDLMDDAYLETFSSARIGDKEVELTRRMLLNLITRGFDVIRDYGVVLVGKSAAEIHQAPSEEAKLEPGDIVRTDYVLPYKNYIANLSRVAVAGEPSDEQRKVYQALMEVERGTAAYARPGVRACDVYKYCRDAILELGYEHGLSLVGHNVGLNEHEHPMLVASETAELKKNMVFCLEPVIQPHYHIQDQYVLTETGGKLLSDKFNTDEMFIIQ